MSLTQVSSAPKIENTVYLGFSAVIIIYFINLLSPSFFLRSDALFFITLFTTVFAAFLYYVKLDKIIDLLYHNWFLKPYNSEIQLFMAYMDAFLRIWETSPTTSDPYDSRAEERTNTAIEGQDLYSDMWSQKGLLFFIISVLFMMLLLELTIPVSIMVGITISFWLIITLLIEIILFSAGWYRHKIVPERCADVIKFRYYQDALNSDTLLSKRTRGSSYDSSFYSPYDHQERMGSDVDPVWEHRNALRNQCTEIDQILKRKEWGRFSLVMKQIVIMLNSDIDSFLRQEALDTMLHLWSSAIAEDVKTTSLNRIHLAVFQSVILPLINQDNYLKSLHALPIVVKIDVDELLQIFPIIEHVNPNILDESAWNSIATALTQSVDSGINEILTNKIVSWLKYSLESSASMIRIIDRMESEPRSYLLRNISLKCDETILVNLRAILGKLDYHSKAVVIELLSVVDNVLITDEDIVTIIDYAYGTNSEVSIKSLEMLSAKGKSVLLDNDIVDCFIQLLRSGSDRDRISSISILEKIGLPDEIPDSLISSITSTFIIEKPYFQMICLRLFKKYNVFQSYEEILWNVIENQIQLKAKDSKMHPKKTIDSFIQKKPPQRYRQGVVSAS